MKQGFLNQKLGKRMSRKAELQRVKLPASKGSAPRKHPAHREGPPRPS